MANNNSSESDNLQISIVIDENNKTIINLDIYDDINKICDDISYKYLLSDGANQKLNKLINSILTKRKEENKKEILIKRIEKSLNRLYYTATEKKIDKENKLKQEKKQKFKELIEKFSFSPKVNFFPKLLDERKFVKIEEKLLNDGKNLEEKNMLRRIKYNIQLMQKHRSPLQKQLEIMENKKINNFFENGSKYIASERKQHSSSHYNNDIKTLKYKSEMSITSNISTNTVTPRNVLNLIANKIFLMKNKYKNICIKSKQETMANKISLRSQNVCLNDISYCEQKMNSQKQPKTITLLKDTNDAMKTIHIFKDNLVEKPIIRKENNRKEPINICSIINVKKSNQNKFALMSSNLFFNKNQTSKKSDKKNFKRNDEEILKKCKEKLLILSKNNNHDLNSNMINSKLFIKNSNYFQKQYNTFNFRQNSIKHKNETKNKICNYRLKKTNKSALDLKNSFEFYGQSHNNLQSDRKLPKLNNLKKSTIMKECNIQNSTYFISNEDNCSKESSRRYLNTSNYEKNLKEKFDKSFEKQKSIENSFKKDIRSKTKENISKFKQNSLKEIFDLIYKYSNNINNLDDIVNLNLIQISGNLKSRLILPCFFSMKKRNQVFNFENFFAIANEIMKNFI